MRLPGFGSKENEPLRFGDADIKTVKCAVVTVFALMSLWHVGIRSFAERRQVFRRGGLDSPQEGVRLPLPQQRHWAALFHYPGKGEWKTCCLSS